MEKLFPLIHKNAKKMTFSDDCWMYCLEGREKNRNIMLMSHHDVVDAEGGAVIDPPVGGMKLREHVKRNVVLQRQL